MLRVEGLWKRFNGRWVLKGINLNVERGTLHVIVGPNGAGKTTLIKCIAGIYTPDAGKIYIDGVDHTATPPSKRGVGVVLQNSPLLPLSTVYSHIAFPLQAKGLNRYEVEKRVEEVAEDLSIKHLLDRRLADLSGGDRQKVAIATALALKPRLLILDEPFAHLDPQYRFELYRQLEEASARENMAILITTHIVDTLVYMSDTLSVLINGKIVESGRPSLLSRNPKNLYTALALRPQLSTVFKISTSKPIPPPFKSLVEGRVNGKEVIVVAPYHSLRAVKSVDGGGVVLHVEGWGDKRIAQIGLGGLGILYALAEDDVKPGERASISVDGEVLMFAGEGERIE